jgi:hypothetical protein
MTTAPEEIVADQKRDQRRTGIILIAVALVLGIALGFVYRTDREMQHVSHRSSTLEQQVVANGRIAQEAKEGVEEANRRLRAAGKPTVPVPTVSPVSPPATNAGESVSVDEVRAIVVTELAGARVTQAEISQIARVAAQLVPKPQDGHTPTAAEIQPLVAATLAAYCAGGRCDGKPGADGKPGETGPPGKDAPPVTDEQLLAAAQQALTSYCAQDSKPCQGPTGPAGPTGADGKQGSPGRGITGTKCQDDGSWLFTYTDESTEVVQGPCRIQGPAIASR